MPRHLKTFCEFSGQSGDPFITLAVLAAINLRVHAPQGFRVVCTMTKPYSPQPRAVVVGAGFAGLGAAKTLFAAGLRDVVLLESGSRVGGRAYTQEVPGIGLVEMGATWMHGVEGHPAYSMALKLGLMTGHELDDSEKQWGQQIFLREGKEEPLVSSEALAAAACSRAFADGVEDAHEDATSNPLSKATLGDYLQETWKSLQQGGPQGRESQIRAETWAWRERLQRAIDGCKSTHDMNAAAASHYTELPGPHTPLPCGYQPIADAYAEELDIRFGHTVQSISWSEEGVTVTCQNDVQIKADAVIVTLPLGVLKECHTSMFQPQLPAQHQAAISALGMGYVEKVFIKFSSDIDFPVPTPVRAPTETGQHHVAESAVPGDASNDAEEPGTKHDDSKASSPSIFAFQFLWRTDGTDPSIAGTAPSSPGTPESGDRGPQRESSATQEGAAGTQEGLGASVVEHDKGGERRDGGGQSPAVPIPAWVRGIYGMRIGGSEFKSAGRVSPEALMRCGAVWMAGEEARNMAQASAEEVQRGLNALFDAFPALKVPREFTTYRTCWSTSPLSMGSYSYPSAQCEGSEYDALAEPIEVERGGRTFPVLQLAGEATSKIHFGTVHGAWFSGQRQAQRLLDFYGTRKN